MATSVIATDARGTGRRLAWAGVVLAAAWALVLFALRFARTEAPVHDAEWWIGDVALASVFALPAIVAVIALKGREHLLPIAAALCFVLAFALLVTLVTLPLLIPATLFALAHRRIHAEVPRRSHALGATIVLVVCAIGALVGLILTPDTVVCWQETVYTDGTRTIVRDHEAESMSTSGSITTSAGPPTAGVESEGGGCTEGVFPPMRSILALGLVAGSTVLTWRMS
jgi:hypothetical protein